MLAPPPVFMYMYILLDLKSDTLFINSEIEITFFRIKLELGRCFSWSISFIYFVNYHFWLISYIPTWLEDKVTHICLRMMWKTVEWSELREALTYDYWCVWKMDVRSLVERLWKMYKIFLHSYTVLGWVQIRYNCTIRLSNLYLYVYIPKWTRSLSPLNLVTKLFVISAWIINMRYNREIVARKFSYFSSLLEFWHVSISNVE